MRRAPIARISYFYTEASSPGGRVTVGPQHVSDDNIREYCGSSFLCAERALADNLRHTSHFIRVLLILFQLSCGTLIVQRYNNNDSLLAFTKLILVLFHSPSRTLRTWVATKDPTAFPPARAVAGASPVSSPCGRWSNQMVDWDTCAGKCPIRWWIRTSTQGLNQSHK